MVDVGIKKVTIKSADLPLIQFTKEITIAHPLGEIDQLFYDFRYRIISEDKNRYSHWSPIETINMPALGDVLNPDDNLPYFPYSELSRISVSTVANGLQKVATVIWNSPATSEASDFEEIFNKITIFDVWIRWNDSNTDDPDAAGWSAWEYKTMVSSNSFSSIIPDGRQGMDVAIQIPTTEKLRDYNDNKLTMFRKTHKV